MILGVPILKHFRVADLSLTGLTLAKCMTVHPVASSLICFGWLCGHYRGKAMTFWW